MNPAVPAAVTALESASLDMLRAESGGFGAFESEARSSAHAGRAEVVIGALEACYLSAAAGAHNPRGRAGGHLLTASLGGRSRRPL